MRAIDADALEELFREVIGGIAKKQEMNGNLEHMVRSSAMVIEMIKDAPTIEPEPHWIPVTEQMPEHKGDYLVTFKLLFTYPVEVCYFDGQAWDKGQYDAVLAWMPLPEPYREGES